MRRQNTTCIQNPLPLQHDATYEEHIVRKAAIDVTTHNLPKVDKAEYSVHKDSTIITFMQTYNEKADKAKQKAEQPELCVVRKSPPTCACSAILCKPCTL